MRDFEGLWNFPNACGAMDGKHINVRCPPHSGSDYFNYKKSFSTILFAVVDARYNFLYIDVGTNGRANDAHVFSKSAFNNALASNAPNVPRRGVFVGDDAFPLRTDLLKPYSRCGPLSQKQRIFNYRLSRARRVVENAFGLLVSRFRIFEKPIPLSLKTTEQVVKTACALHNWLHRASARSMVSTPEIGGTSVRPFEVSETLPNAFQRLPRASARNHRRAATRVRDLYADSFVTTQSIQWQWEMI